MSRGGDSQSGDSRSPVEPATRFGVRAALAAAALALLAVPGAPTLFLVEDKWAPLLGSTPPPATTCTVAR